MIFLRPPERKATKVRRKRKKPPSENDEGLFMGILQTLLNLGFIILVFTIASSRGEWILDVIRYFQSKDNTTKLLSSIDEYLFIPNIQWPELKPVQSLPKFLLYSAVLSVFVYNILAGLWYWLFYSGKQRKGFGDIEEDSTIFNDVILSSFNIALGSVVCALISWYIPIKQYAYLYYDISNRGWIYFSVSVPALFLYHEVMTYYRHRALHAPVLYRTVHFWRHWPKQTTWSLYVMHPVELVLLVLQIVLPIYLFPVHNALYILVSTYAIYTDLMFHSNKNIFQQNHRKHKNVNFGASTMLMDWACGTLRRDIYDHAMCTDPSTLSGGARNKED
ncbi:lathosterol oxidase-like [Saccostrea echinata]|uniref:lathosterol oxidase-like n=1 Tax=Saccostrea echinata TaxID=191078 RepID=UPI002A81E016|nr:lathosterol oxidase-like [Saccostrea echinata]